MASDADIRVLSERVSNALDDLKEMKGQLNAVNTSMVALATMQERITHVDSKATRLFAISDSTQSQIAELRGEVRHQGWMWKISGAALLACMGAIGWAATKYDSFNALVTRVTVIEHTVKGEGK
jgi:hypothetical protein